MSKTNHFSRRFASKSSEELRLIKDSKDHTEDAQLAALWELEKRGESTQAEAEQVVQKETQKLRREKIIAKDQRYNTFLPRFIAIIIDWVVLTLAIYGIHTFSYGFVEGNTNFRLLELILEMMVYAYSIALHAAFGQTLGKMAMGIKVVRLEDEGDITFRHAFLRDLVPLAIVVINGVYDIISLNAPFTIALMPFVLFFISWIPSVWGLIEVLTMLTNEKSRAVHDFIAKTVVIRIQEKAQP